MFPLKDKVPSQSFPLTTILLIVINIFVFFYELSLGPSLEGFAYRYGVVPRRYFLFSSFALETIFPKYLPLFSYMFLHGGWFHLVSNMWFLWLFGDNVEDRMGHGRFFLFFLLCGLSAALFHLYTNHYSPLPTIGASGAVSGVMGAYFVLFPRARIITLVPIFFFFTIIEIPALVFLLFWFFLQFLNAIFFWSAGFYGGVAWWAHIGGFICGVFLVFFLKKRYHPLYHNKYIP